MVTSRRLEFLQSIALFFVCLIGSFILWAVFSEFYLHTGTKNDIIKLWYGTMILQAYPYAMIFFYIADYSIQKVSRKARWLVSIFVLAALFGVAVLLIERYCWFATLIRGSC
jgi:hypothetical protein